MKEFLKYTLATVTGLVIAGIVLIIIGVGMLVDNSIVVLENITRLRDNGMPPDEAAIKGTSEVAIAITASTLTTLAVFLPTPGSDSSASRRRALSTETGTISPSPS